MRNIKKELEEYEEYYKKLKCICYGTRIGLGEDILIAQIKNSDDDEYILKLLCYIELRRNGIIPKKILNDVNNFPSKEEIE